MLSVLCVKLSAFSEALGPRHQVRATPLLLQAPHQTHLVIGHTKERDGSVEEMGEGTVVVTLRW